MLLLINMVQSAGGAKFVTVIAIMKNKYVQIYVCIVL